MKAFGLADVNFKADLRASIVVFLVALPLAMGISIASGYPPAAGLITGVVGGIVVGMLGGAPLQVSGAAAGLTVVVLQGVQQFGIEQMGLVVVLAGLMQLAAGAAGLGRWFQAVSPTVLHAMLAGIGILIVASQFHVMLDFLPKGGGTANLQGIPDSLMAALAAENHSHVYALIVGALSIALMVLWPKVARGPLKLLPGPLLAVATGALLAWSGGFSVKFVNIPSDLFSNWSFGTLNFLSVVETPAILAAALQLALIASAESLLCAAAVDRMHTGARARFSKELSAQGIGNALCGLLGAIPMTGVIVRSSANVSAGASSRLSAILHGVWLLLFVWLLPEVLGFIPIAALAGILVFTGVKLVNLKEIKALYRYGRSELVIYVTTVAVIVSYDLLIGVVLGLVMSSLKLLRQLSHLSVSVEKDVPGEKVVIKLRGAATFLRLPKLVGALEQVPPGVSVEISSSLQLMDSACIEHLDSWSKRHKQSGGNIELKGSQLLRVS